MPILVQPPAGAASDVHVDPGTPAGALRRHLALLTGDPRWAAGAGRLAVDGAVLDDAHPAGVPPLLPGARASLTPRGDDPVAAAARADRHLAVVAGPDAGHVRALGPGARVTVTGAAPGRASAPGAPGAGAEGGAWRLDDGALAGARVEVRRRGRSTRVRVVGATGAFVAAHGPGSGGARRPQRRGARADGDAAPGAARLPGGPTRRARRTRVGRRWRRWPAGRVLHTGTTTFALRIRGADAEPVPRPRARRRPAPWAWSALASAVTGAVLAVALRQPLLLVGTAVAAAGLLASRGAGARDAADAGRPQPGDAGDRPDDGDAARGAPTDVAALRVGSVPVGPPRPAEVAGALAAPGALPGWPADGALALVGERPHTLAAARALVLRALAAAPAAPLHVRGDHPHDWTWARWLAPRDDLPAGGGGATAAAPQGPVLVVADGPDAACARWRAAAPAEHHVLVLVPPGGRAPAWAGTVVHVRPDATARTDRAGARRRTAAELVGVAVAEDTARRLAAARHAAAGAACSSSRDGADAPSAPPALPAHVSLGALPGVPAPEGTVVADRWAASPAGGPLHVPLGSGAGGAPVLLDLDADGPHVLVAGTTGAGKSELLTTLVLGLALQHPPQRLALLLADFKGGTGLGPLAGLPHVVDHVDDLDPDAARRTLVGLRAELRRRERVLTAAGAGDLRRLDPHDPATPPRLVVVVDELRALVDDVPDATEVLARIAAQGRALGVHLVLATQRPAGVVTADLRANVTQRLALRVADDADARDVVGTTDPARLDPGAPGRAVLRVGARPVRHVQVARARRSGTGARVRLLPHAAAAPRWRPAAAGTDEDDVRAWVLAARDAADGRPGPAVPWCPALPGHVRASDVPPGPGLALALADEPEEQRRTAVRWDAAAGPLLVLGGPRSGRSTALLALAEAAARDGTDVHALGLPAATVGALVTPTRLGTVLPADDPHRTGLLLRRLLAPADRTRPALLLVDRLDVVLEHLGRHARGVVADMLAATWRDPVPGLAVAASAAVVPQVTRLTGSFPVRLVLPCADPSADAAAGVPVRFAADRRLPGRAVLCDGGPPRLCQVVVPATDAVDAALRDDAAAGHTGGDSPVRVVQLPLRAVPDDDAVPEGRLAVGVGGDGGEVVHVDAGRALVVAGPPGTGRTTALAAVARGWAARGHRVLRVAVDPHDRPHDRPHDDVPWTSVDASPPLPATGDAGPGATGRTVVVLDDVDEIERTRPDAVAALEALLSDRGVHVAAVATTTAHAAAAFRGPVSRALRSRQVLVLDPHDADAAALLGPDAALHADPGHRGAGRGVLRRDRELVRVQVHAHADVHPAGR